VLHVRILKSEKIKTSE